VQIRDGKIVHGSLFVFFLIFICVDLFVLGFRKNREKEREKKERKKIQKKKKTSYEKGNFTRKIFFFELDLPALIYFNVSPE
jgi:hypothetical protein